MSAKPSPGAHWRTRSAFTASERAARVTELLAPLPWITPLIRESLRADPAPKLLVIESAGDVRTPRRYRNEHGQLVEGAINSDRLVVFGD